MRKRRRRQGRVILTMLAALGVTAGLGLSSAQAVVISNEIPEGTLGHFRVELLDGGESRSAFVTGEGTVSGLMTPDILFDYFSYVDIGDGAGGTRLSNTTVTSPVSLTGTNEASSAGTFTGSEGNTIEWNVVSSIPDGGNTMTSIFTFTATEGTLGSLLFNQYLDEDVLSPSDDVLVVRGTAAGGDLELFTINNVEEFGISHSGALSEEQGLVNALFEGWAADQFSDLRSAIQAGTAEVSLEGEINEALLTPFVHPTFGAAWGPTDITTTVAWIVDPDATTATLITTLGGVPTAADIPPVDPPDDPDLPQPDPNGVIPEPVTASLGMLGLGALAWASRRRRT